MADPETGEIPEKSEEGQQLSGGTSGGAIGLNMAYITSISGILKIVEFFTLMIAFALGADSTSDAWSPMDFFLFVTITLWIIVMVAFVLFAFNVIAKINIIIDWNIPVLVLAAWAVILLLISSSLIVDSARNDWFSGDSDKLRAAAAFGFISTFVFIGDGVVHFLKMRRKM